jgi:hypothetical protein
MPAETNKDQVIRLNDEISKIDALLEHYNQHSDQVFENKDTIFFLGSRRDGLVRQRHQLQELVNETAREEAAKRYELVVETNHTSHKMGQPDWSSEEVIAEFTTEEKAVMYRSNHREELTAKYGTDRIFTRVKSDKFIPVDPE